MLPVRRRLLALLWSVVVEVEVMSRQHAKDAGVKVNATWRWSGGDTEKGGTPLFQGLLAPRVAAAGQVMLQRMLWDEWKRHADKFIRKLPKPRR